MFLTYFIKVIKKMFFRNAPWQETFADARDGDGRRGANRDQYLFHPLPNIRFLLFFQGFIDTSCFFFTIIIESYQECVFSQFA